MSVIYLDQLDGWFDPSIIMEHVLLKLVKVHSPGIDNTMGFFQRLWHNYPLLKSYLVLEIAIFTLRLARIKSKF
jgi:hypothetical protein